MIYFYANSIYFSVSSSLTKTIFLKQNIRSERSRGGQEGKANIPDLRIIENFTVWRTLSACINFECCWKISQIELKIEWKFMSGWKSSQKCSGIDQTAATLPLQRHLQLIHPFLMLHLISRQKTKEHSRKNVVHQFIYFFADSLFAYLKRYFKLLIYEHPSIQPEVLYSLIIYFWLHHDCFLIHSAPVDIYFHFAG